LGVVFKLGRGAIIDRALRTDGRDGEGRATSMRSPSLAEQALAQIKAKGYAEKYLRRGKKMTLIGVAFDAEMRNLSDRAIEVV